MRRWLVVGAVVLTCVGVGRGAVAQEPPSSTSTTATSTTTTVVDGESTTTEPPLISPAPPDLALALSFACPVSVGGGGAAPVPGVSLSIVNRGGPLVVDLRARSVVVVHRLEVPTSYLGIPQQVSVPLPPGDPDDGLTVDVLAAGTDRVLGSAGIDHGPSCASLGPLAPPPPAEPRPARPTYTG